MQTEAAPRPRFEPSAPFNERLHWNLYPLVASAFFLPMLPVALAAAVLVPWFVSDHGLVVNGQPWLYAPLLDLVPSWAPWAAGSVLALVVAVSWGIAVHLIDQALRGRSVQPTRALVRSVMRSPWTLAAGAVVAGVVFAADTALLQVYEQAHPALRFGLGAVLFASLTPLWLPLAGVHVHERPGDVLKRLRGRGLLTGRGQWGPVSIVVGCAAVFAYLAWMTMIENTLVLAVIAALAGLTAMAVALTLAATGQGPIPQERLARPYLAVGSTVAITVGITVPLQLYQDLLTDGPWPTLRYETSSVEPWDRREANPQPLILPEDGASVVLGTKEQLCEEVACLDLDEPLDGAGPVLGATDMAGGAVRTVRASLDSTLAQGSIVVHDQCVRPGQCRAGTWELEPQVEPGGQWDAREDDPANQATTLDLPSRMAVWGGAGGGRHMVVTAAPSVGLGETLLTLFSCGTDRCSDPASTLLVREPNATFASTVHPRHDYPSLISVTATDQGVPRVSVHHPGSGALTLYACHDVPCTDFTTTELLPPTGVLRMQRWDNSRYTGATMQVRPDHTPVIVYRDTRDGSVQLIDCADQMCQDRDTVQVLGPDWQRTPPALALDAAGLPQIAAFDVSTHEVLYLACADERCQTYDRTVVGVYDHTPGWIDLELDGADRPHLAWHRVADENVEEEHAIELVRCATAHCAS
ncbi:MULTISPECIES: hypothetical protein [Nocardiopsis]|uniref:Uncharacterized protein n=1 Tax=Nocardiopsis sinuspersici TaxID=501010 RepID=A0A1V3BUU4_9ACTN|nr:MULTISPECIES: hypothetical protein [Nocardiopsis]OOC52414.1 hypothetical protein NOSIN_00015 [Nocardiopsis sinuspersici]